MQKQLYGEYRPIGHTSMISYEMYDRRKYEEYYKFTFVRNPMDRFVSAYFFLKKGGISLADKKFSKRYVLPYDEFSDFVHSLKSGRTRNAVINWIHFRPQYLFLLDSNLEMHLDFIAKVENFDNDLNHIAENLGVPLLSKEVVNQTNHPESRKVYSNEDWEFVKNIYEKDIELFGYGS